MTRRMHYFEDLRNSQELGRQALRGGAAAVASTYANGALQLASAVILGRLLTPEDFGLVAIVAVLTNFAPFLIDFGLGDATTQRNQITPGQVSSLFWVSTGIGCAAAAVIALCSPLIARMYHDPRVEPVALCSAAVFLLIGMTGQHVSLLRRTMQFAAVARIQILSTLAGLAVAIPMAMAGYGYWALVLRPIASAFCAVLGAWLACPWRPGLPVFDNDVMSMLRFGTHIVGYSIVASVSRSVDRIALGLFYPPKEVGCYHNALLLYENSIFNALTQIHSVGSAALGKLQANPADLRNKYETALSTLAFFVMPAAAVLSVTARDVVVMLLGERWRASGLLLSIMALRGISHVIQASQGWLHLSTGRPDRWKNWGVLTAVVQTLAVLGGLPFGATGVAVAFVASGWLIAFPSIGYAGRPVGIGAGSVLRSVGRQLLGAVVTAAAGWWLLIFVFADFSAILRIVLSAVFCTALYLLIVAGVLRLTEPIGIAVRLIQDHLSRNQEKILD